MTAPAPGPAWPGPSLAAVPAWPWSEVGSDSRWRLAADHELAAALAACPRIEDLERLRRQVRTAESIAKEGQLVQADLVRLGCLRLQIERRLGAVLAQTVKRGGRGSKSPTATSKRGGCSVGLPDGVTKQQAHRWRQLARCPDEDFAAGLAEAAAGGRVPAVTSFLAAVRKPARRTTVRPGASVELAQQLAATFGGWTCGVGVPQSSTELVDRPDPAPLRGQVWIGGSRDPGGWLRVLQAAHRATRIREAVVHAAVAPDQPWFRELVGGPWLLHLLGPDRGGGMLCYLGPRERMFALALGDSGTTLRTLRC